MVHSDPAGTVVRASLLELLAVVRALKRLLPYQSLIDEPFELLKDNASLQWSRTHCYNSSSTSVTTRHGG